MIDNARRARSVALDGFLDACEAELGADAVKPSTDPRSLVVDEPLQPFASRLYLAPGDGSPPAGISPRWCRVAQAIGGSRDVTRQAVRLLAPTPAESVAADQLAAALAS